VLFRRQAQLLRFRLEDGLQVLLRGRVSVYEQRGQMQLIAEYVEPVGAGSLQVAFEQLKARLAAEGLFAADRKRALPRFPRCIGIVTSPAGAVIRDFLHVAGRRHAALEVLIYPAVVQGETAAAEVAAGIAWFNRRERSGRVDVVVVARGGGSLEDLAPFNSELLARAIAASELPVVSAVGHETDFTIADFVADLRAPTPSAAAELITEAHYTVTAELSSLGQRLERAGRYRMMMARQRLTAASIEAALARLRTGLNRREQRVDEQRFRLDAAIGGQLRRASDRLQQLSTRLARQDAKHRLQVGRERWTALEARLARAGGRFVEHGRRRQELLASRLAALSPLSVLARGYALVFDADGKLVKDASAVDIGDALRLQLGTGQVAATATEITKEVE
jgi:exodeoxyribonuclease VII large subunit